MKQPIKQPLLLALGLLLCSLLACKEPCADRVCLNGGICYEGKCQCQLGFEGEDCELESIPTSLTIHQISVVNFPDTVPYYNFNQPWDSTDAPDVYVTLDHFNVSHPSPVYQSAIQQNATPPVRFDLSPTPYSIFFMESAWTVFVYDSDPQNPAQTSQSMANLQFKPIEHYQGTPDSIMLGTSPMGTGVVLWVEWGY